MAEGADTILLTTEDLFLYEQGPKFQTNIPALKRLFESVARVPGVELEGPPVVNSLFPRLPKDAIEPLRAWCPFYDWDVATNQLRWMTSFDTTEEDVERFSAGVRAVLG